MHGSPIGFIVSPKSALTEQIYFVGGNHLSLLPASFYATQLFWMHRSIGSHHRRSVSVGYFLFHSIILSLPLSQSLLAAYISFSVASASLDCLVVSELLFHTLEILFASRFHMESLTALTWMLLNDDYNSCAYYYFYKEVHIKLLPPSIAFGPAHSYMHIRNELSHMQKNHFYESLTVALMFICSDCSHFFYRSQCYSFSRHFCAAFLWWCVNAEILHFSNHFHPIQC